MCLGTRDRNLPGAQDSMVVLNFGQGWFDGGNLNKPGAGLFSPYWHYVPISAIEAAVKAYIQGYWACSAEDQESQIMVAIGTNNYGGYGSNTTDQNTRRTYAYEHGKVWAQMVVRLIQWVWSSGYSRQVSVAGAIDIEWDSQLTGWNTPYVTYGWVNGFDNYDNGQAIFYNFGACVGCPPVPTPIGFIPQPIPGRNSTSITSRTALHPPGRCRKSMLPAGSMHASGKPSAATARSTSGGRWNSRGNDAVPGLPTARWLFRNQQHSGSRVETTL